MNLIFATQNQNKANEIQKIVPEGITVLTLKDIGCTEDIPETAKTLEGNARLKSFYVYENYAENCFADDTGLEVDALNGEPGVYSARYAGEAKSAQANMDLLLEKMKGEKNRNARFRTVISLVLNGEEYQFEGVVEGKIREKKSGAAGFGYDPIFEPNGYSSTFAEMSTNEKNAISHRGKAVRKLIQFLNNM